jgi:ABC-type bacteriocin/lantibiotic exporter with double-glycine peptidase domain
VAIQYIIGQLNTQINQLTEFLKSMQEAKISLERIGEIHLKENENLLDQNINIIPLESDILLEKVKFSYFGINGLPNIKNINLPDITYPNLKIIKNKFLFEPNIKKELVIMVGYPGSGKSTISKKISENYTYKIVSRDIFKTDVKCKKIANELIDFINIILLKQSSCSIIEKQ